MKRIVLFFFIALSVTPAWAGPHFGFSGGVNMGGIKTDWKYIDEPEVFARFGYSLGVGTEIQVKNRFSMLIDLNLVSKNYAYNPEYYGSGTEGFDRYSLLYLDLPFRLNYTYKNMRVFTGPFIDYCISGANRYNFHLADSTAVEGNLNIKSGKEFTTKEIHSDRLAVNYLDGGLIIGIGYRCNNYCLDLSYSLGLINIYPEILDGQARSNNITKTRMFMLNLFFYL